MLIDGKAIADGILEKLRTDVEHLKTSGVIPTLAVILVGNDPASLTYIKQKQKAAEAIGATLIFNHIETCTNDELKNKINTYNIDPKIHGIIIQRPILKKLDTTLVKLEKDVDGFLPNSPFEVPVAIAVEEILKTTNQPLTNKDVVVIGRGDTAGKPIAEHFAKLGFAPMVINSQTLNPNELMKTADIIISCVGKERVVTSESIKEGVILISVGIWRNGEGKMHGDYDEADIENKASYYTPTPRGVGPVNVACLMQNLIKAAKNSH